MQTETSRQLQPSFVLLSQGPYLFMSPEERIAGKRSRNLWGDLQFLFRSSLVSIHRQMLRSSYKG